MGANIAIRITLALLLNGAPPKDCMPNANVEEWLSQSQWVFRGTVINPGAANLKAVPSSAEVTVVKVNEILHGAVQFTDYRDRDITLFSNNSQLLTIGTSAIFFTRSWLYGESLAVVEVGRLEEGSKTVQDDIRAAQQNIADRLLSDRIAKAELVIAGKVISTRPYRNDDRRRIETEHEPDWWEAEIAVQSVIKGKLQGKTIGTLFAKSLDELWIDSPKCNPGQEGIWILQRNQTEKGWPVLRVPGLTALDPLDFQPLEQMERLRRLLNERR
jgi:hypothetical protein